MRRRPTFRQSKPATPMEHQPGSALSALRLRIQLRQIPLRVGSAFSVAEKHVREGDIRPDCS
jgi:hypothetical protein